MAIEQGPHWAAHTGSLGARWCPATQVEEFESLWSGNRGFMRPYNPYHVQSDQYGYGDFKRKQKKSQLRSEDRLRQFQKSHAPHVRTLATGGLLTFTRCETITSVQCEN